MNSCMAISFDEMRRVLLQHDARMHLQASKARVALGGIPPAAH